MKRRCFYWYLGHSKENSLPAPSGVIFTPASSAARAIADDDEVRIALGLPHNVRLHRGVRRSGHAFTSSRPGCPLRRFEALLTCQKIKNFRAGMGMDRSSNSLFVSRSKIRFGDVHDVIRSVRDWRKIDLSYEPAAV